LHFLTPDAAHAVAGRVLTLTGAEAHHAATVRRVRTGERITLGDGAGTWVTAECVQVGPKQVDVRVLTREDVPPPSPRLVLVQALAKGDRDELAVQAATELGADEIIPWQASRSVSRWAPASWRSGSGSEEPAKAAKGRIRWEAIVREAAKQAHRPWVPAVGTLVSTADLAVRARDARILVLEPSARQPLSRLDMDAADGRDVAVVVGPEGGIAPDELDALAEAGAVRVRLGETVLRTSTAGPAALAVVSTLLGRW